MVGDKVTVIRTKKTTMARHVTDPLDTSKVIVGATGSGKTVTAKGDVQLLLDQRRHVVVVDPTGVWWGMRSTLAGDAEGFDLPIFGGEHGDVPVLPDQGAAIARIVLEQRVSAIVDLKSIDNSRDWRRFMHDFVAELRRGVKGNFHLVVDEADEFAAERPADDIGFTLRENLIWIAKRGRAQGFVPTWITQRTAEIAKAVISQAQTIVVHQLIAPSDLKAIDDYLKGHGSAGTRQAVMSSLPELAIGERWIYSPRLKILERGFTPPLVTFDSSRTPGPGEQLLEPRTLAQIDVSAIRAALAPPASAGPESQKSGKPERDDRDATIARLKAEAVDMRSELAELREVDRAFDRVTSGLIAIDQLVAAVQGGHPWPDLQALRTKLYSHDANSQSLAKPDAEVAAQEDAAVESGSRPAAGRTAAATAEPMAETGGETPPPPPVPSRDGPATGETELKALAGLAAVYPAGLTEAAWAARTGYSRKGGAWLRRRKRYVDDGLIEERDGRWFASAVGVERAGTEIPDMPAPGAGLVAWWASRVSTSAAKRALQLLGAVHPRSLTRDAIAVEIGMAPKGGAFLRAVTELKASNLVTEAKKRLAVAAELMGED